MPKIPQHGDPELLPKPVIEAPSNRYLPYGPSGEKLPDGPLYAGARKPDTDVKGLPWVRYPNEKWTSPEQRMLTLEMIRTFLKAHPKVRGWAVKETDQPARQSTLRGEPVLRFSFTHQDGRRIETAISFSEKDVADLDAFAVRIAYVQSSLNTSAGDWL